MAKNYSWSRKDALSIMGSRKVQGQVKEAAERGVKAFKRAAGRQRTGAFRRNVRVEPARGWDGRPGYRIVAFAGRGRNGNAPVPIEFGTSRQRGVNALQASINAIQRGR